MDSVKGRFTKRFTPATAKRAVVVAVIMILVLTFLGFPPPVGIETRPQSNVSLVWLVYFFVVMIIEIGTIPMIYRHPSIGGVTGIIAGAVKVVADQSHLLQPEIAPFSYSILQSMIVIASVALAYFSWVVYQNSPR